MRSRPKELYKESMKQKFLLEKLSKIDKSLANMTKWRRKKIQINKVRDVKGI
jgi:hypothetical protein